MLSLSRMRQNWLPTALLLEGYNRHNAHISQKATATRVLQGHYGKMRDFLKETIFNQTKHSSFKAGGLLGTPAFQSVWHLKRYSMQYASWSNKQFWVHLQAFQARRQFHPIGYTLSRQDFLIFVLLLQCTWNWNDKLYWLHLLTDKAADHIVHPTVPFLSAHTEMGPLKELEERAVWMLSRNRTRKACQSTTYYCSWDTILGHWRKLPESSQKTKWWEIFFLYNT